MSTTTWPQRPPEPVSDLAASWEGTPETPADLSWVRRELRAALRHRPWPTSDEADLERLLLIVEELASNGLRHGRPPVRVLVTADLTGWLLDVSDAAADRPPAPAHDRDPAAGGLGLPLVARLSAAHGWTVRGERKHVWARIDATAAPAPSSRPAPLNGAVPQPRQKSRSAGGSHPGAGHLPDRVHGVIDDCSTELGFLPELQMAGPVSELTSDIVIDLLAVLREALSNVARHARARSAHVALAVTVDGVTLQVLDDGIGLAAAPRNGGLADLRRRAAWHGGTLSVQLQPAGGTRLTWAVPRSPSTPLPLLWPAS
jgi:anti-sigma regulatory factor (Ser/Thr protein kinase)